MLSLAAVQQRNCAAVQQCSSAAAQQRSNVLEMSNDETTQQNDGRSGAATFQKRPTASRRGNLTGAATQQRPETSNDEFTQHNDRHGHRLEDREGPENVGSEP